MKQLLLLILLFSGSLQSFCVETVFVKGIVICNKKGVKNILVTDGRSFVRTDEKGHFKLNADRSQNYIYYTLPTGYESPKENGIPVFYERLDTKKSHYNFEIKKTKQSQLKHAFIVWADPQVIDLDEIKLLGKVVTDVNQTVTGFNIPVHGISCGDIVFDKLGLFPDYKRMISQLEIPFYQVIGNHDMDYSNKTHETSYITFENKFGPTYYSFNKGNIHYVVLNNVFYYGYSYHYMGYIGQLQLDWLSQDLKYVPKGSTVVVALHIPTKYADSNDRPNMEKRQKNSLINNGALYEILKGYNVHILAGHSHTQWNTQISDSILEHTHAAASAAWWQGEIGLDGTPKGYTVYEADGNTLSWYFKGVGLTKENQMKIYPIGSDIENPDMIIANVYNYDPQWKVVWYENGELAGQMEQYWGVDPQARADYQPGTNKKHSWLKYDYTNHIFKAIPKDKDAKITIEVVDRFGNKYTQELNSNLKNN